MGKEWVSDDSLWKGQMRICQLERAARCKGSGDCDSYGVIAKAIADAPKNKWGQPDIRTQLLGIPKGKYVLVIDNGSDQPLIFCETHARRVLQSAQKAIDDMVELEIWD